MKSLLKPSISWLLVFVPVAVVLRAWPQFGNETALFICSYFAIVPLAGWMGRATEELAERLGHGVGGLLNATFGNAAELIIALVALSKGLTGVVKANHGLNYRPCLARDGSFDSRRRHEISEATLQTAVWLTNHRRTTSSRTSAFSLIV
jgi:hypothetical protein